MLLQTVRQTSVTSVHPLRSSQLDGSQWVSSEHDENLTTYRDGDGRNVEARGPPPRPLLAMISMCRARCEERTP